MADIENYTLDSGYGRTLRALDFANAKSASDEIQRSPVTATVVAYG